MSKDVKFNIKLSIDGKERLRDSLLKFNGLVTMFRF